MEEKLWAVIKFPHEDDAVAAVPTKWLNGNMCYWPPWCQDKVAKAIKHCASPDESWQMHQFLPLRNNIFDCYDIAIKKSQKATLNSDLGSQSESSNPDIDVQKKRKSMKTKFTRFKSFEVLEEDSNDEERSENFKCQILPKPPNINGDKKRKRSDYEGNNCEITPSTSSSLEIGGTKNIKILSNVVLNHQEDSTSQVKDDQLEDQSVKSASQVPSQAPYNARPFSGNNLESGNIIEYLKKIIRKQNLIQSTLLEMAEEISELKKHVRSNAIRLEPEERESIFTSLNLPVNTQEDLDALEEFLNDETRLKNAVKDVCTSGGKDVYELIYRATGKLITNGFASGYSFYGKKQKMKFSALKLNKLLIDSAVKTFICTEKEAEVSIAKWLKRCTERAKNERR